MDLLPGATWAPTLYGLGDSISDWAVNALRLAEVERLIVVGCSVGGSCALEVAALAPERVAALVLVGTKAAHRPEPAFREAALARLACEGVEAAWEAYWAPLFSPSTDPTVIEAARQSAWSQGAVALSRGVSVFHSRPSRDALVRGFPGPLWVVMGADDSAPKPETSASLAASAPGGRLWMLPACGHYVPLEQPRAFRNILVALLERLRKTE